MPMERLEHPETLGIINKKNITIVALLVAFVGALLLYISTTSWFSQTWLEFFNRLGTVFFSSMMVALIYNHMLRTTFLKEMRSQISDTIRKEQSQIDDLQKNAGLQRVHDGFPTDLIVQGFSNAQRCIQIFTTWIPDIETIEKTFPSAIKRGCRVQILLLDPKSCHAKHRAKDLGYPDDQIVIRRIEGNLAELGRFCCKNEISKNAEIRLYSETPTLVLFAYDGTIVFSPYLKEMMGLQAPQIEVRGDKSLFFKKLKKHFNNVWNSATPYLCI